MRAETGSSLAGLIDRELRLPEIDGEACVHAQIEQAHCSACVEACPRGAWVLDEDALGLDTEACDGCGLCIPDCPTGALHIHMPWVVRLLGGNPIALFACEHSEARVDDATLPCIHALGIRQLLLLYSAGIRYLLLSTGDCQGCDRCAEDRLGTRLGQLNLALKERHHAPMKALERSPGIFVSLYRSDEVIPHGTRLGRREFLRGGTERLREQLAVLDPLNRPDARRLPPGELLPDAAGEAFHWPWVPVIDEAHCNGCDACAKLCPTGALSVQTGDQEKPPCYHLVPAACTGCGICSSACEQKAVTVHAWEVPVKDRVVLAEHTCRACGNRFHLPEETPDAGETLCPICRQTNHASRLFQVLQD
ncbi:MAG: hypothetical protein DSZ02_08000 [Gammaproteobacteria bacterium]|nr:MAG: hypothetical protein DSZ02_08000 [Gammaproteobacteria bacterium]